MSDSPAVTSVEEHLAALKSRLLELDEQWSPTVAKLKNHISLLEKELVLDVAPDGELSVTAQVLLEEFIAKVDGPVAELAAAHRAVHGSVSKVGKEIERNFSPSLKGLIKNEKKIEKDPKATRLFNGMLCDYLMNSGHPEIAETFVKESGLDGRIDDYLCCKDDLDRIMTAFRNHDVAPAVEYLEHFSPHEKRLKFELLRQNMLQLIMEGNQKEAIAYSKQLTNLGWDEEVGFLMGAVIFKKNDKRYRKLHSIVTWKELEEKLAAVLYRTDSNLAIIVETGVEAVPALLNLRSKMAARQECLMSGDELPIEVKMPHYAHSTFTCPILRQQSTDKNPPMRLTCGHVISREALEKLCNSNRHFRLKCPYCPMESSGHEAKRIYI